MYDYLHYSKQVCGHSEHSLYFRKRNVSTWTEIMEMHWFSVLSPLEGNVSSLVIDGLQAAVPCKAYLKRTTVFLGLRWCDKIE